MYRKKCQVPECDRYDIIPYDHMYYTCLDDERDYHYFCEYHAKELNCPIHQKGQKNCEAMHCESMAKKYTRTTYTCLEISEYHFFCDEHHSTVNCQIHHTEYKR